MQQILTAPQDHHGTLCSCVRSGLWQYHQPVQVHLRHATGLHGQDGAADLARLHRVSHYETEVRHSARPILPVPVRQRAGARVVPLLAARRLLRVYYVRWLGHSRKYLPSRTLLHIAFCRSLATEHLVTSDYLPTRLELMAEVVPGTEEEYPCTSHCPSFAKY